MKKNTHIKEKFGRLLILKEVEGDLYYYKYTQHSRKVLCLCDCGREKVIDLGSIVAGRTRSCGCLNKERAKIRATKHGKSLNSLGIKSKDYNIWTAIKGRCYNPRNKSYKNYGGRGIVMCPRWREGFENFINDMGERPSEDYSIERKNNDGNYEPSNCIWILKGEQSKNTRRVHLITYKEKTQCLTDWCRELKIPYSMLRHRVYDLKLDFETALKFPKHVKVKALIDKERI